MCGSFRETLRDRIESVDSVVSVGLDPAPDRLPDAVRDADLPRWAFNRRIIDATHEHAACYKPNAAFYEDPDGWRALQETVAYAHGKGVPVLLDAKRGDIGNTARQYARVLDEEGLGCDAITLSPYLGRDSLEPFLRREAGLFVLARTSNAGGADFQNLTVGNDKPLYEYVAQRCAEWDEGSTADVGLVVGATTTDELADVRDLVPDLPFLVPGVGAQGGDAEAAVEYGLADGVGLVNSSRGIIFAGEDSEARSASNGRAAEPSRDDGNRDAISGAPRDARGDFFSAAGDAARRLKRRLNEYR